MRRSSCEDSSAAATASAWPQVWRPMSSSAAPPRPPRRSRSRCSPCGRCSSGRGWPASSARPATRRSFVDVEVGALLAVAPRRRAPSLRRRPRRPLRARHLRARGARRRVRAARSRASSWSPGCSAWRRALRFVTLDERDTGELRRRTRRFVGAFALAEPRPPPRRGRPHPRHRARASRRSSSASRRTRAATACSAPASRPTATTCGEDRLARAERRGDPPVGALRARPPAPLARPAHRRAPLAERRRDAPPHQRALDGARTTSTTRPSRRATACSARRSRSGRACRSHGLKPSLQGPLLRRPCPVRALAAMPVLDGETLRGILAVDRLADRAVHPARRGDRDPGRAVLPARHPERARLRAARAGQGRARQALSRRAGARRGAQREGRRRGRREGRARDRQLRPRRGDGLRRGRRGRTRSWRPRAPTGASTTSSACASRTTRGSSRWSCRTAAPCPTAASTRRARQVVLTKRLSWPSHPQPARPAACSCTIAPLGTLILGAKRRHAFGDAVRPTLEVLASHLAVSLSNARMVHKLETMATTDGLTGLLNKRAMLEAAVQKIARRRALRAPARSARDGHRLLQEGERHPRPRRGRPGHPRPRARS